MVVVEILKWVAVVGVPVATLIGFGVMTWHDHKNDPYIGI